LLRELTSCNRLCLVENLKFAHPPMLAGTLTAVQVFPNPRGWASRGEPELKGQT